MPKKNLDTENKINADLALRHRLYVPKYDFCLCENLRSIRDGHNDNAKVVLHYENGTPIGVAVYEQNELVNIQIFVKKSMRRKGIGKKLILSLNAPENSVVSFGNKASQSFWEKQNNFIIFRH